MYTNILTKKDINRTCHKARFMAFALNSFKMLAWSHTPEVREKCFSKKVKGKKQLVFEEEILEKLWRWGHFAVKFYVPQFLLATLGRDAPGNDPTSTSLLSSTGRSMRSWRTQPWKTSQDTRGT